MNIFVLFLIINTLLLLSVSCQENYFETNPEITKQYGLALEAIFGMGLRLQTLLDEDQNKNFLVSPISATVVLAQLMLGADPKFRDRLFDILSLPKRFHNIGRKNFILPFTQFHLQLSRLLIDLDGSLGNFTIKQKSALFYNNKIKLNTQFEWNLRKLYNADVEDLDFDQKSLYSQNYINEWASHHTNGLINNIMPVPPNNNTGAIFANALYFLGEWEYPFSDTLNRNGAFNITEKTSVPVTYMVNFVEQIWYSEASNYRIICLPYKNEEVGMYIIYPNADNPLRYNIKAFIKSMKSKEIIETLTRAKRRDVTVTLPKLTLTSQISILRQLKKYNIYKQQNITNKSNILDTLEQHINNFQQFNTNTTDDLYLTNAADKPIKIDDIIQEIIFSINEKGTEAAAITASTINLSGGAKNIAITRPFSFFIKHEPTSVTLFWGSISNP